MRARDEVPTLLGMCMRRSQRQVARWSQSTRRRRVACEWRQGAGMRDKAGRMPAGMRPVSRRPLAAGVMEVATRACTACAHLHPHVGGRLMWPPLKCRARATRPRRPLCNPKEGGPGAEDR